MKKFATIALTLAMAATAACASATTVGICQLVQHEALDAATQGFKDALTEKMPDVKFDEQNAAGDAATVFGGEVSDSVETLAHTAGTIPYEILCSIGRRVPRVYLDGGREVDMVNYLRGV